MRAQIRRTIDRAILADDTYPLIQLLECHQYSQDGDHRALEGLGWKPLTLSADEINAVCDALESIEP